MNKEQRIRLAQRLARQQTKTCTGCGKPIVNAPHVEIEELRAEEGIYSVLINTEVSVVVHAANEKEAEDRALQVCNATLVVHLRSMRVIECAALTSDNKLGES